MALLLFMTLAAWSMGSAVGSSPDEDYVLTSIWCGTEGNPPYCRKDPDQASSFIVSELVARPQFCYVNQGADYSASCQRGMAENTVATSRLNKCNSNSDCVYPKRYFETQMRFVSIDIEKSVLTMRIFNCIICAVLVIASAQISNLRNLDAVLVWLTLATPFSFWIIASVNTTSWAIIGTSAIGFSLVNVNYGNFLMPQNFYPLVSSTFGLIVAVSSRRESTEITLLLIAIALICYKFEKETTNLSSQSRNRFHIPIVVLSLTTLIFYQFRDLISFEMTNISLLGENLIELPKFFLGIHGSWGLGWFETFLPQISWIFANQAFLLIIYFHLKSASSKKRKLIALVLALNLMGMLFVTTYSGFRIGSVIQPRYFLPFVIPSLAFVLSRSGVRVPAKIFKTVCILIAISNSIALRATIQRYTSGNDHFLFESLNETVEWWWNFGPNPEFVWIAGSMSFIAFLLVLAHIRESMIN